MKDLTTLDALLKQEAELNKKIDKATSARMALPIGSSRARVTTYNARLFTLLESRQRVWDRIKQENEK